MRARSSSDSGLGLRMGAVLVMFSIVVEIAGATLESDQRRARDFDDTERLLRRKFEDSRLYTAVVPHRLTP